MFLEGNWRQWAVDKAQMKSTGRRWHFWGCQQSPWQDIQGIFISIKPSCGIRILPNKRIKSGDMAVKIPTELKFWVSRVRQLRFLDRRLHVNVWKCWHLVTQSATSYTNKVNCAEVSWLTVTCHLPAITRKGRMQAKSFSNCTQS